MNLLKSKKAKSNSISACSVIRAHFGAIPLESLITASRTFPATSRVDLQLALEKTFENRSEAKVIGVHPQYTHETVTFSHLLREENHPVLIGPLQYVEIDVGETLPARCLKHGLWLAVETGSQFALLLTPAERFGFMWRLPSLPERLGWNSRERS